MIYANFKQKLWNISVACFYFCQNRKCIKIIIQIFTIKTSPFTLPCTVVVKLLNEDMQHFLIQPLNGSVHLTRVPYSSSLLYFYCYIVFVY